MWRGTVGELGLVVHRAPPPLLYVHTWEFTYVYAHERVYACACLLLARSLSPERSLSSVYKRTFTCTMHILASQSGLGGWGSENVYAGSFLPSPPSPREEVYRFSSLLKPRTRSRSRSPRRSPHRPHPLRWSFSPVILSASLERVARDRSSAEIAEGERARESGWWGPRSSRACSFTGVSSTLVWCRNQVSGRSS